MSAGISRLIIFVNNVSSIVVLFYNTQKSMSSDYSAILMKIKNFDDFSCFIFNFFQITLQLRYIAKRVWYFAKDSNSSGVLIFLIRYL